MAAAAAAAADACACVMLVRACLRVCALAACRHCCVFYYAVLLRCAVCCVQEDLYISGSVVEAEAVDAAVAAVATRCAAQHTNLGHCALAPSCCTVTWHFAWHATQVGEAGCARQQRRQARPWRQPHRHKRSGSEPTRRAPPGPAHISCVAWKGSVLEEERQCFSVGKPFLATQLVTQAVTVPIYLISCIGLPHIFGPRGRPLLLTCQVRWLVVRQRANGRR